ncbi:hypothetical protein [Sorangium sp. So ce1182]|uniref:hypothetical protein n=1 Tax=Sorangium sp. So ce1182 TaxID=3133334 RepID=UPI003F62AA28
MSVSIGITRVILAGVLAISSTSASAAPETTETGEARASDAEAAVGSDGPEGEAADAARAAAITVIEATYGANCGASHGNQTYNLAYSCNGLTYCRYAINHHNIGDPAYGCAKEYTVRWRCMRGDVRSTTVPAEASGKTVTLACDT